MFTPRRRASHCESAADAHCTDRPGVLVAPHLYSSSAVRESEVRHIPVRCAVEGQPEGLDQVRAGEVCISNRNRICELIQARIRPVQEIRIEVKRSRNLLLSHEQADKGRLFRTYLVIDFPDVLPIILVRSE